VSPFPADTLEDFQEKLNDMTVSEMQDLASNIGLIPKNAVVLLRRQLTDAFIRSKHKFSLGVPAPNSEPTQISRKLAKLIET
jgi:hypothetical protein